MGFTVTIPVTIIPGDRHRSSQRSSQIRVRHDAALQPPVTVVTIVTIFSRFDLKGER